MATEDLVTEQFQLLGIDIQKDVLQKCVSLCEEYDVDAEDFVERWMAFSLTHNNGARPTLENLDLLVRKEFSKQADRLHAPVKQYMPPAAGTLNVYGVTRPHYYNFVFNMHLDIISILPSKQIILNIRSDNEVLSNYMTGTPMITKQENESVQTHQIELCPATYSPSNVSSAKYSLRSNAGSVMYSYGDEKLLEIIGKPNILNDTLNLTIIQVPNDDGELYTESMFGFELLHEKASICDNHIHYLSRYIMKKSGIADVTSVKHKTQTETAVAGRIECDADARLNSKSVVLQGTWEESLSQAVTVDMDNVKKYSLFPGQVVVMRGVNIHGNKFMAHEVFHDASQIIPDHKADIMNSLRGTMSIIVVAGPYTTSDNMAYEPLKDLISYVTTHKPHVVLMTGPFLDAEHSKVKDNTMAETYKSFFDKLMDSLGELSTTSPSTKIYIISSIKDAFHVNIYPTPPYYSKKKYHNITFVPDPCTLNISGIVVGVTSTDILMHISQEEISLGMGGDKLARLASHVICQQSYYPLCPPPAGHCVDAALWAAHAQMACTPHLLVLPSNFRFFVKEINGCVVVNPEHLTKGTVGGTFARVLVSCENDERKIAAQILRI